MYSGCAIVGGPWEVRDYGSLGERVLDVYTPQREYDCSLTELWQCRAYAIVVLGHIFRVTGGVLDMWIGSCLPDGC